MFISVPLFAISVALRAETVAATRPAQAATAAPRPAAIVRAKNPARPPREPAVLRFSPLSASDLYAARVRRRLAGYLRMRLLELRKAGLERAADVVQKKLPLEKLFERR